MIDGIYISGKESFYFCNDPSTNVQENSIRDTHISIYILLSDTLWVHQALVTPFKCLDGLSWSEPFYEWKVLSISHLDGCLKIN